MSTLDTSTTAHFAEARPLDVESPTLVEGLPGLGLVASIAVDRLVDQLDLELHGTVRSEAFPPAAAFADGRIRDAVRVSAGKEPPIMTIGSDVPIPPTAARPLGDCLYDDLAQEFERAIFVAGVPAETQESAGETVGAATTDDLADEMAAAGIDLAEEPGYVGNVTGGLVAACHREGIPAALLLVQANPRVPDPGAARTLIEDALEPLLGFDIDTQPLLEQAEEIQERKEQIAEQLEQSQGQNAPAPGMYQ